MGRANSLARNCTGTCAPVLHWQARPQSSPSPLWANDASGKRISAACLVELETFSRHSLNVALTDLRHCILLSRSVIVSLPPQTLREGLHLDPCILGLLHFLPNEFAVQGRGQHQRHGTDDDEAAAFNALALLGTIPSGEHDSSVSLKAGEIALGILKKNPQHPGAAHYALHAYDDGEHAAMGLQAARTYARIAPASSQGSVPQRHRIARPAGCEGPPH